MTDKQLRLLIATQILTALMAHYKYWDIPILAETALKIADALIVTSQL